MSLVPYAPVVVVALILVVWFVRWRMMWGPQLRVLKHGTVGDATVEVRREGQPAYRAQCQQWFDSSPWSHVAEGARTPVRIDRKTRSACSSTPRPGFRELLVVRDTERERHAKRQADLRGRQGLV